jgi:CBS domain-containing protein
MLNISDLKKISLLDAFDSNEIRVDNVVYKMLNVEHIMVKNPIPVQVNATIKSVVEILAENDFHALPVVDKNELVGIVTTTDLLKYLLKQYEIEASELTN